jgi:hypothetical protein
MILSKSVPVVLLATCVLILAVSVATAMVIDHDDVAGVASFPQSTMDAIGQQKWYFTHASVGGNMLSGMNALHGSNAGFYQLQTTPAGSTPPPVQLLNGYVYENNRGNPGWSSKFAIFDQSVDNGWRSPRIDFAMDKLCYIDPDASSTAYTNMMSALEASYPATTFVYTTMPLTTLEDSSNVLRNNYNNAVRTFCMANDKLLFDIADIEAHDALGSRITYTYGNQAYDKLYSGYASDEGHLLIPTWSVNQL